MSIIEAPTATLPPIGAQFRIGDVLRYAPSIHTAREGLAVFTGDDTGRYAFDLFWGMRPRENHRLLPEELASATAIANLHDGWEHLEEGDTAEAYEPGDIVRLTGGGGAHTHMVLVRRAAEHAPALIAEYVILAHRRSVADKEAVADDAMRRYEAARGTLWEKQAEDAVAAAIRDRDAARTTLGALILRLTSHPRKVGA